MSRGAATAQRHHFPQNWPQLVDNLDKTLTTLKILKTLTKHWQLDDNLDKILKTLTKHWQLVDNLGKTLYLYSICQFNQYNYKY